MYTRDMMIIEKTNQKKQVVTVFLLMIAALLAVSYSHAAENDFKADGIRTIVIDPGHGGYDIGVRGADGSVEKDVSLNVARILAKELKPQYQVVLTRNGDYQVDLTKRASVANNQQGTLFIGIHTGGGSMRQTDAWSVFYFKGADQKKGGIRLEPAVPEKEGDARRKWDQVQLRHQKESLALAGCIKAQLGGPPEIPEVNIAGAALRVLEGVDMPAIIIETGYLTNPTTEKRLNDEDFLIDIAGRIKKGVDIYLSR